jgi:hypothetical protein
VLDEASKRRVKDLCDLIAKEQDHHRFSQLLAELNQVLDGSDLSSKDGNPTSSTPVEKKS